ncbi:RNA polymerase sigma factor [Streptomyces sp. NPDC085946]|uniref:RNA polymerase sigma factor n=1 Tax=Streptomyces sp. NPDC085946 TaxID=3365744 RepID=UPI0037D37A40
MPSRPNWVPIPAWSAQRPWRKPQHRLLRTCSSTAAGEESTPSGTESAAPLSVIPGAPGAPPTHHERLFARSTTRASPRFRASGCRRGTGGADRGPAGARHARGRVSAADLHIVGRALESPADTDDLVQDVMLETVRDLRALRDPEALRSWLAAIAMRQARRHWRIRRASAESYRIDDPDGVAPLTGPGADFVDLTITVLELPDHPSEFSIAVSSP